ncbi:unnamed protein product [Periconia digitata]|uniref:Uncharacterized protein n=1 Tax=Periconia digitata TaxID=1303443 RepID=A0A9W4UF34_9PLEO|nr:unnamed protein product [Periconia digitata]
MRCPVHLALIWASARLVAAESTSNTTYLTATALVTKGNDSAFECWQLTEPFRRASVPGISGAQIVTISNNTDLAYSIIPPRFDGGIHNAPVPQIVHFLSGLAYLTLPHNETEAWVVGGVGGLLFAVDTVGTGHRTQYPSDQETVAIALPFAEGKIPDHTVLVEGPCNGEQTFV